MKTISIIVTLLVIGAPAAKAQTDTTYRVEVTATASPTLNLFRHSSAPTTNHTSSLGGGVFVRSMWHPGRLLSIGFMTGYLLIDQEVIQSANQSYRARLSAIPLQFGISMGTGTLEVGVGIGPYMMLTSIEGGESPPTYAHRLELGLTYYGFYLFRLNDEIRIGPELRVLDLRYRGIVSFMPSCSVRIDLVKY